MVKGERARCGQQPSPPHEAGGLRSPDETTAPVIRLEWLVPDAQNEVVLFDDSRRGVIVLESERPVVERGTVGRYRTAGDEDVSGWAYVRFEGGPTLYHPPEVTVTVVEPAGDRRSS